MGLFRSHRSLEDTIADATAEVTREGRALLRNIGWVSAGVTAVALGVVIGRELRQRYKFTRRTPYDVYSHSGDESEFSIGI